MRSRTLLTVLPIVLAIGDARSEGREPTVTYVGAPRDGAANPREDGDRALAAGRFEEALSYYQVAIERNPVDRHALREAGRAAHALRKFPEAVQLLNRADELATRSDAELHYLLGEALWVLDQRGLARKAHEHALVEIGDGPYQRIERLWQARIYGRLDLRARANAIYDAMAIAAPDDPEIALAQAEMNAAAADWPIAERAIRRLLAHAPDHTRALEMLAWILEAHGAIDREVRVRAKLAKDGGRAEVVRDYGRALERSGNWAAALDAYRRASVLPDGASDLELARALARVEQKMSIEVGGGLTGRTDPSASGIGAFAGVAVPFGRASHWTLGAWHELAQSGDRDVYSGDIRASVMLRRGDAFAILGGRVGLIDAGADATVMAPSRNLLAPGAVAAARSRRIADHLTLAVEGELNTLWRETPRAVFEGGRVDAVTAHAYVSGLADRLVIDSGLQGRRLSLSADDTATPHATQALAWGGADVVVWRDFTHQARGELLDDDLLRPTYAADSLVLAYRHYELFGDTDAMFASRIALADRASIDEVSFTMRKVLAHGAVALEARGGVGRDWVRDLYLARGGLALWISPGARSRFALSFDLARESVQAFVGERRTGWMNYHVDL